MITEYTPEAGLRNLEREMGTICRKVARKIAEGARDPYFITQNNLGQLSGATQFYPELDKDESQVGLVHRPGLDPGRRRSLVRGSLHDARQGRADHDRPVGRDHAGIRHGPP